MPTEDDENSETRINRRKALKAGAGAVFTTGFSGTALGATDQASQGPASEQRRMKRVQRIVELKVTADIESPATGEVMTQQMDKFIPNYYVDDGRAFVVSSRFNELSESPMIIRTPDELVGIATDSTQVTLGNYVESSFQGFAGETYETPEEGSGQELRISVDQEGTTVQTDNGNSMRVRQNQTEDMELASRKAVTRAYEEREIENPRERGDDTLIRKYPVEEGTTTVKPTLSVRDLGPTPVFSVTSGMIFPESMPSAQFIRHKASRQSGLAIEEAGSGIVQVKGVAQ